MSFKVGDKVRLRSFDFISKDKYFGNAPESGDGAWRYFGIYTSHILERVNKVFEIVNTGDFNHKDVNMKYVIITNSVFSWPETWFVLDSKQLELDF